MYQIQYTESPTGASPLQGQTVTTGGIVIGVGYNHQPIYYFVADRQGGLWHGVLVRHTIALDTNLAVGDSVHFQAVVEESSNQTRMNNLTTGSFVRVAGVATVPPAVITTGSMGESAEGVLVELGNVIVTAVTSSGFTINDGSGPANVGQGWDYVYEPLVGDTLRYIRGIVSYTSGAFLINPRSDADIGFVSNRPPVITNVVNTPAIPTDLQSDTVSALITDESGVASARAYYRFGESGDFNSVVMYNDGLHGDGAADDDTWGTVIPAGPARGSCYYYLEATDTEGATGRSPADAPAHTYSYVIRSSHLTIFDLQYTGDPTGGSSPYDGQAFTVTGVVTGTEFSSYRDGFFISDTSALWSGLQVFNPQSTPAVADCVLLSGTITEYNGLTEVAAGASYIVLGQATVPDPIPMRFTQLADSGEPFEGTLARLDAPMVVSDISDWSQYRQFGLRSGSVTAAGVGDFAIEYVPVLGDSINWMIGCVTYNSNVGWMIAPRSDADIGYVDRRAPSIVGAAAVADTLVNVTFNERLSPEGLDRLGNYHLTDQSDLTGLHVLSAYLFSSGKILQIRTLETLLSDHGYQLTIDSVRDASPNANLLLNATIGFAGFEQPEYVQIADIYNDFQAYNNRVVILRGIVNFVQDVTTTSGSRRISAYMQDESGRGFSLSQTGAASTFPGIQRGNLIVIRGTATSYESTIQLGSFNGDPTAGDVVVLAEHMPLPAPIIVETGDHRLQKEIVRTSSSTDYGAGTWVQTTGTIYLVEENVGGGTNVSIDDGTGNLTIRIWDSMNLDSVSLNGRTYLMRDLVGVRCSVAGPSSTYNGDFQMLAGYAEDFTVPTIPAAPEEFFLEVPNRPFAPDIGQKLHIFYGAPVTGEVRLRVFDLRGHLVTTLVQKRAGGPNEIVWDGRNELNELLPIGTYILHLESVRAGSSSTKVKPIVVGTKL